MNSSLIQVRYWIGCDPLELNEDTYTLKLILIYPTKLDPPVSKTAKTIVAIRTFSACNRLAIEGDTCW